MAVLEIGGIVGKADDVIGGVIGLGLDILAIGTIVVSLKPAFEAIKSQSWNDFPMISIPILISSWFLISADNDNVATITPMNLANIVLSDGVYIKDVALDTDQWGWDDEEEAETGGYY